MKGFFFEARLLSWTLFLVVCIPFLGYSQLSITSVSPNPACDGGTVAISGTGFTASTVVSIAQTPQTVTFVNANSLQVTINTGFVGADSVAVSVTEGASAVTDSLWLEGAIADFQYVGSPFCTTDTTIVLPVLLSSGGGTGVFSSTPTVLMINSNTGGFDPSNAPPGTYTVEHTITTPSGCTYTQFAAVEIRLADTSSISYPGSPFCENGNDPFPLLQGLPGGTYFSTDGAVFANSATGEIDLDQTGPGTYTVNYVLPNNCAGVSDSATVEILPVSSADFFYSDSVYCQGEADPIPSLMSSVPGVFSESTGLLVIDSLSGAIDLSASVPQNYLITYITSSAQCPDTFSQVIGINYGPTVTLHSNLQDSVICEGTEVELTATGGMGGDNFTFESKTLGDLNWTLLQDGSGPYADLYTTSSLPIGLVQIRVTITAIDGCTSSDSLTLSVNPIPSGNLSSLPTTICSQGRIPIVVKSLSDHTQFNWTMSGIENTLPSFASGITNNLNTNETDTIHTTQTVTLSMESPGQIRISVVPSANGCLGSMFVDTIQVIPTQDCIFIPGGITPNNDGANDFWEVSWEDPGIDPQTYELEVFNRLNASVKQLDSLEAAREWKDITLADGPYWFTLKNKADNTIIRKDILIIKRKEF